MVPSALFPQSQVYRNHGMTATSYEAPPPPDSLPGDYAYGNNFGSVQGFPEYGYPAEAGWPATEQGVCVVGAQALLAVEGRPVTLPGRPHEPGATEGVNFSSDGNWRCLAWLSLQGKDCRESQSLSQGLVPSLGLRPESSPACPWCPRQCGSEYRLPARFSGTAALCSPVLAAWVWETPNSP